VDQRPEAAAPGAPPPGWLAAGPVLAELERPETMGRTTAEAHTLLERVLTTLTEELPRRKP
jgi:hypothetical protein